MYCTLSMLKVSDGKLESICSNTESFRIHCFRWSRASIAYWNTWIQGTLFHPASIFPRPVCSLLLIQHRYRYRYRYWDWESRIRSSLARHTAQSGYQRGFLRENSHRIYRMILKKMTFHTNYHKCPILLDETWSCLDEWRGRLLICVTFTSWLICHNNLTTFF